MSRCRRAQDARAGAHCARSSTAASDNQVQARRSARDSARLIEAGAEPTHIDLQLGDATARQRRALRPQQPHPPVLPHPARLAPGLVPKPQKKSARTAPRIAPPVSCASISRCSGVVDSGMRRREEHRRAERNRARIDGDRALARAAARRACRAARRSRASSEPGARRRRLRERTRSSDSRRAARAACRDAPSPTR